MTRIYNALYLFFHAVKKYSHFILGVAFLLLFTTAYFLGEFSLLKATIGIMIGIINIGYGLYVQRQNRLNHSLMPTPVAKSATTPN